MPNEIIREEIAENGVLPFARFMELALYCPETGYYETDKGKVGRGGDFITSVSTGNLFGQLLAFQFAEWLEAEVRSQKSEVRIIEAGAHDGKLAADILTWLECHRPQLFARLEYFIIEPSACRQAWQNEMLKPFAPRVRWVADISQLAGRDAVEPQLINGIIFSNELLDAFPIHRFGWDAKEKKWFEWGVAVADGEFVWAKIQKPESHLPSSIFHLPSPLLEVLPDDYIIEASPSAESWWRAAARVLARGKLMAVDYGFTADEIFSPARVPGTLRAYFKHRVTADVLANPGEQDLTAHVNFSAIQNAGEAAGLVTESFSSQAKFLTQILAKTQTEKYSGGLVASKRSEDGWDSGRTRQFQTLTHPEHFGRAFRVLVQSK